MSPLTPPKGTGVPRPAWKSRGVLVFAAAALMAAGGLFVLDRARRTSPVLETRVGTLGVRLEQARWVTDHMDHGGGFDRPPSMMPGMPEAGAQRLSVELAFRNAGGGAVDYRGEEFSLVSDDGATYEVVAADLGTARLASGQALNTALYFDVDTTEDPGRLRLLWQRGERRVYLQVPPPPDHYHAQPRGDVVWPADATILLPLGNFDRGETLYKATYGCIACHGDPRKPGSNPLGPHLGTIALLGAERIAEKPAHQYLFESILRPNDYVVEECRAGVPCSTPSAMPDYAEILDLQGMADLIAYLLQQTGEPRV